MARAKSQTAGRCRCGKVAFRRYRMADGIAHRLDARVYYCAASGCWHVTNSLLADYVRTRARIGT